MRAASKPVKRRSFSRRFFSNSDGYFGWSVSGTTDIETGDIQKTPAGFTIIETLIVLAVTAALFLLAFVAVGGKQNETEFQQGINDFQSSMQQIVNQVNTGNYQEANKMTCDGTSGTPILSSYSGPTKLGTNLSCVLVGKAVLFANQADPQKYVVYPIAGVRRDQLTLLSCIDIGCTNPLLGAYGNASPENGFNNLDTGVRYPLHYGLSIKSVTFNTFDNSGPPPVETSTKNVGAFGIMQGISSTPGSQQFYLVPIDPTGFNNDPTDLNTMANAVKAVDLHMISSYNGIQSIIGSANPNYDLEICLASGTTNQSGKITIGGNGGNLNSITTTIYSNKSCT